MPPHLHRRPSMRQPLPPRRRPLLLPPHHPKTRRRPAATPRPPLHLRPFAARSQRSFRYSACHRRSSPPHRLQRHRPPPRRPPPLRPPDRQPQPPQTRETRTRRSRRRDHRPPRTRCPRPTRRSKQSHPTQERCHPPPGTDDDGTHDAKRARVRHSRTEGRTGHYPQHSGGRSSRSTRNQILRN